MDRKEVREIRTQLQGLDENWKKPEERHVRIKISSLVNGRNSKAALGIIVVNDMGRTINAWSISRDGNFSPVETDLEAIRYGLILAQQEVWRKI